MITKRFKFRQIFTFVILVLFAIGILYLKFREQILPVETIKVANQEIKVELAQNPFTWQKGLGDRSSLEELSGMLFIFPSAGPQGIWMKDMQFPIDIIWIDQGKIVDIAPNIKPTLIDPLPVYLPRLPARMVLEVNAGLSQKSGWKIGDSVGLLTK